jgi:hypothetical protein
MKTSTYFPISKLGYFVLFVIMSIATMSCMKSTQGSEYPSNETYVVQSSDIVNIQASDIISERFYFKRKIDIVDKRNNSVHDSFVITVRSNNQSNDIYTDLKNNQFSGSLQIETDSVLIETLNFEKGVLQTLGINTSNEGKYVTNIAPTCKISLVQNCVSQKIKIMSKFGYILCLAAAPECYAGLWAECSWDLCVTGEQNISNLKIKL